jgi:hypothetical protein
LGADAVLKAKGPGMEAIKPREIGIMLSARKSVSFLTAGLLAATFGASIARADTVCKGLAAEQCSKQTTCLWIQAYTRKDGKAVNAYCRNKGKTRGMTDQGTSASYGESLSKGTDRMPRTGS